jgi:hypothetical protein
MSVAHVATVLEPLTTARYRLGTCERARFLIGEYQQLRLSGMHCAGVRLCGRQMGFLFYCSHCHRRAFAALGSPALRIYLRVHPRFCDPRPLTSLESEN